MNESKHRLGAAVTQLVARLVRSGQDGFLQSEIRELADAALAFEATVLQTERARVEKAVRTDAEGGDVVLMMNVVDIVHDRAVDS